MCGRYALALRPAEVQSMLAELLMPSQEDNIPDDEDIRQTHNFAPGYYGLVYRPDVPDYGNGEQQRDSSSTDEDNGANEDETPHSERTGTAASDEVIADTQIEPKHKPQYRIQAMKWGLIPFWTKRNPDYGSLMRTINCRDDSLAQSSGMWTTMKARKRCIVVAQGFYEWLKKNGGKERIPHFVKRKDGQLMCFAGLWDCVRFEDSDEKLYTYTIITTEVNKQLSFLHDRMPVIFDNGSEDMFTWLDPSKSAWDAQLQSLLEPYSGELECYQVPKEVGKVGNDSPRFVVPIDSAENKQNIINFFANQKKQEASAKKSDRSAEDDETTPSSPVTGQKRPVETETQTTIGDTASPNSKAAKPSPQKPSTPKTTPLSSKKVRNATSNMTREKTQMKGSPVKGDGSKKITSFFNA